MSGLDIHQLFGLPAAKVFGALFVAMLIKAPDDIDGDAGIKRVVGAKDNVNLPIHDLTQPFQKRNRQRRSSPSPMRPRKRHEKHL